MNAIFFDFDGTIADSFDQVLGFLLKQVGRNIADLSPDEKAQFRGLSMKDLALRVGIPRWKLPVMYLRGRAQLTLYMHKTPPFAGMDQVLAALRSEKYQLFILSSNSKRNINRFLIEHGLSNYFDTVYGSSGWFVGKALSLRKALKKHNLEPGNTIYVGDEVRDIVAAHVVGMPAVAVTWGFGSEDQLLQHNPTIIVRKITELQKSLVDWGKSN